MCLGRVPRIGGTCRWVATSRLGVAERRCRRRPTVQVRGARAPSEDLHATNSQEPNARKSASFWYCIATDSLAQKALAYAHFGFDRMHACMNEGRVERLADDLRAVKRPFRLPVVRAEVAGRLQSPASATGRRAL